MAALRSTKRRNCPIVMLLFRIRAPNMVPMSIPVPMKNQ